MYWKLQSGGLVITIWVLTVVDIIWRNTFNTSVHTCQALCSTPTVMSPDSVNTNQCDCQCLSLLDVWLLQLQVGISSECCFWALPVESEAICKWGAQYRHKVQIFWCAPHFSIYPHMRGHNDSLLPTERQLKCPVVSALQSAHLLVKSGEGQ